MNKERLFLLILASAMFTHIMDFMIMMPLGPQLMRLFDITPQQFSFLVSSYSFTAGASGFLAAFLIDRFDRKSSLVFIYTGFLLGTIACALAPNYQILLLSRCLAGAFGGVLGALILSIVSDAIPLERRAAGIGIVMASFSAASVFGVPFGLYLASLFSWQAPFFFLAGISLAILFMIRFLVPAFKSHLAEGQKPAGIKEVIKNVFGRKNPLLGLLFTSVLMFGHFTIIPFIAPYMVGNVGFTEQELTYIYLVGGALTIFSSPWVGRMADKNGRLKVFTIFGFLVLIPIIIITHMPPIPLWEALVVSGLFFVLANGRMVPSTTMVTSVIRPENRGSFMSARSSIQQMSSGLATLIAGTMITERPSEVTEGAKALVGYENVGWIAVVFSLLALLLARTLRVAKGA
ncbi:MFS transporter [Fulvivirga sedimenti]|uniref:MFS transporter n=1 Tax=Fulvivirga sedimenti TaxID=2879465 RepID=A0A9X1HUS0_9BACT|nr:MFS transporter [Fulvivirga sedimenti]MCA6074867.1 MFS transporter [Fulvivirga sedimenti]MCA6076044.1 MFS transporter [Fulvivirga sedimenti]MCA6077172.1 MFS transporter [Fulvivirga sedimenti]